MGILKRWFYSSKTDTSRQSVQNVLLIALCLILLNVAGCILAIYFLAVRLMSSSSRENPYEHVCTNAIFCLFFRLISSRGALGLQLVGSLMALTVNAGLVSGVILGLSWALLLWLCCYFAAIVASLSLFVVVLHVLVVRDNANQDVSTSTYCVSLIPLLLSIIYIICWGIVFKLWREFKKNEVKEILIYE